jgi:hypothetical protein
MEEKMIDLIKPAVPLGVARDNVLTPRISLSKHFAAVDGERDVLGITTRLGIR